MSELRGAEPHNNSKGNIAIRANLISNGALFHPTNANHNTETANTAMSSLDPNQASDEPTPQGLQGVQQQSMMISKRPASRGLRVE